MISDASALQISSEDIGGFHRDGAVLLKEVLSQEWLDLA